MELYTVHLRIQIGAGANPLPIIYTREFTDTENDGSAKKDLEGVRYESKHQKDKIMRVSKEKGATAKITIDGKEWSKSENSVT